MAKKTIRHTAKFELKDLDDCINNTVGVVHDLQESVKLKRTNRSKKVAEGNIQYFGSVAYHLQEYQKLLAEKESVSFKHPQSF